MRFLIPFILFPVSLLGAEELAPASEVNERDVDALWLCIAAFLVFLMQAGFAYVEAGFTRAKNVLNILMKNISDFCLGSLGFWLIGFSIMFGPHVIEGIGLGSITTADNLLDKNGEPDGFNYAFFIFQLVFCATAATIASGAMAERTRFISYLIYSFVISALIYPVFGSMVWANLFDSGNEGFLTKLGFYDFAGSTVVHSIGAWVGLAGAIVLGPRSNKYGADGSIQPLFGHNMSMAALGMFLLWFGWFGFNPGSTGSIKGASFAYIAVTTNMAAVTGGLASMITSWVLFKRPDISMVLNGCLAGLVAITAVCDSVTVASAGLIGGVAGMIVVGAVVFFDYIRVDDPVGAVSVHGVAGAWGTLSYGIFASPVLGAKQPGLLYGGSADLLGVQAIGVLMGFAWAFGVSLLLFYVMKVTIGIRVSVEAEEEGLDIIEHGNEAYWFDR